MTEFELTIDELVIENVSSFEAMRIGQAIKVELERLLQDHGLPLHGFHEEMIIAPTIEIQPTAAPEQVSKSIAQAIYQVLNENPRP